MLFRSSTLLSKLLYSAIVLLLSMLFAAPVSAQFYPFYDHTELISEETGAVETRVVYPFFLKRNDNEGKTVALSPVFSWYRRHEDGSRSLDILWPAFSSRYRAETVSTKDYRSTFIFPMFFDRSYERKGVTKKDRMLFPLYYQGKEENIGSYFILFPIVWYAYNARLITPLFPKRPQTFAAVFPLMGDFRGYHNRDRIFFLLWPLFVYSNEGTGEDFNEVYSFVWPFFAKYGGPNVSGFRIWPLFAYANKTDEYKRIFFLWPLGHYRTGRISKTNPEEQNVFFFFPFYGNFNRENTKLFFVFPFYGKLQVKDRTSTGYLLAIYNREVNTRRGYVEDRFLWFIYRNRRPLPGFTEEDISDGETFGGGVFPFYTRVESPRVVRKNVIWPLGIYRMRRGEDEVFERTYVIPFYAKQERTKANGIRQKSEFFFPIFRSIQRNDGTKMRSYLHLFFYGEYPQVDRIYAPLWTVWEREEDPATGELIVRTLKSLHRYEVASDGTRKRTLNLFLMNFDRTVDAEGNKSGKTRFLFGLAGRHRDEEQKLRTELLGFKF